MDEQRHQSAAAQPPTCPKGRQFSAVMSTAYSCVGGGVVVVGGGGGGGGDGAVI